MNIYQVTTYDYIYVVIAKSEKRAKQCILDNMAISDLADITTVELKGKVQEGIVLHYDRSAGQYSWKQ